MTLGPAASGLSINIFAYDLYMQIFDSLSPQLSDSPVQARSSGNTVATFFPYQPRLFHKSEQAQIFLLRDVPPTDLVFLLVALIYMELRRQDKQVRSAC